MAVRTNRVAGEVVEAADINALAQLANSNEARVGDALAIADADATVAGYIDDPGTQTGSRVVRKNDLFVNVKDYGAVGDGTADDTAAIQAAIDAAGGQRVFLPPGTYKTTSALSLGGTDTVVGANSGSVVIKSTTTAFVSVTPEQRVYAWQISGCTLDGPGKTVPGSIGLDLSSVSSAIIDDLIIRNYEKGVRIGSVLNGGAVYNRFSHVTAQSCGTGFAVEASGSNASVFSECRANGCATGWSITDSNDNTLNACQIESCTTGIVVNATSVGMADANAVIACRFENNTTAWNVTSSNVRDFAVVNPHIFGTYTISDSGTRTQHLGVTTQQTNKFSSALQSANGSWRFERVANGGTETPAAVFRDSVTSSGTPVTVQAETEKAPGYFYRGVRSGVTYFDVSSTDGSIRLPKAGYVELSERTAAPSAPSAGMARLYLKDNGSGKTQFCVLFATGAEQVVAVEP